jgi:hypothetical protein
MNAATILTVFVLFVGCSSTGTGGAGGAGGGGGNGGGGVGNGGNGGGGGGAGGSGGSGGQEVAINGVVRRVDLGAIVRPLGGASVSIAGDTAATTSAADGSYSLMAMAGSTVFLVVRADRYQATELGYVVPNGGGILPAMVLFANQLVSDDYSVGHITPNPARGTVFVNVNVTDTKGGETVSLSAMNDGPFIPAVSTGGTVPSGSSTANIMFPNVVPGSTTVTLTAPAGKSCATDQAITDWRVEAGVLTNIDVTCK